MEFTDITQIISNVGFPIGVATVCFWFIYKLILLYRDERANMLAQHRIESEQMTEALNNNTKVLYVILERLGVENEQL